MSNLSGKIFTGTNYALQEIYLRGQEGVSFRKIFSVKVEITRFLTFQILLLHKHYFMTM